MCFCVNLFDIIFIILLHAHGILLRNPCLHYLKYPLKSFTFIIFHPRITSSHTKLLELLAAPLVRCKFHSRCFIPQTNFKDDATSITTHFNCSSLVLTVIFPTYSHKLCFFLCSPLPLLTPVPCVELTSLYNYRECI